MPKDDTAKLDSHFPGGLKEALDQSHDRVMERRLPVPEPGLSVKQDHPEERLLIIVHVFRVVLNKSEVDNPLKHYPESDDFIDNLLAKTT